MGAPRENNRLCVENNNDTGITMKKAAYLYVERDDSEYDYKTGFASYTEANNYRQECQRMWMGHCDYVYLWTGSERINLTRTPEDKRIEALKQFNISE